MKKLTLNDLAQFPRPDLARDDFQLLDGEWQFKLDPKNLGLREKWYKQPQFDQKIRVPFCVESAASGIEIKNPPKVFWYARQNLIFPPLALGEKLMLNFSAVDYAAKVWLNGKYLGEHTGGYTPFQFDVTQFVAQENQLVVRVEDGKSLTQPRGKQTTFAKPSGIFYPTVSGIWQSVWLEKVGATYLKDFAVIADLDQKTAHLSCELGGELSAGKISCEIADPTTNKTYKKVTAFDSGQTKVEFGFQFKSIASWSPDSPQLYVINLKINTLKTEDNIVSYFGFRKIEAKNQQIFLNNQPFYQKLVLVQGYYPGGLYTPTKPTQYQEDLLALKKLGFNGLRMHQKIESSQFLYWCDVLGCVVWAELPSARHFSQKTIDAVQNEWLEVLRRDRNHPSIITWVIFNESWGLGPAFLPVLLSRQAIQFVKAMVKLTKQIDPTRLVIDNSGFDHTEATDIVDLHLYLKTAATTQRLLQKLKNLQKIKFSWLNFFKGISVKSFHRQRLARGEKYQGQPVIVSEYGGFGFFKTSDSQNLVENFKNYTQVIKDQPWICGYCFTQLYDTFQEKDGLLNFERKPKADIAKINIINQSQTHDHT